MTRKNSQYGRRSNLFVTRLEDRSTPAVLSASMESVRAVEPAVTPDAPIPGSWLVHFRGYEGYGPDQLANFRQALNPTGVQAVNWLGADGLFSVAAPPDVSTSEVTHRLADVPGFESIEQDYTVHVARTPGDKYYSTNQTNLGYINAPAAWDINVGVDPATGKARNVIAILDTGISYSHPDLAGNMWKNPYEIANNGVDDDGNGYPDDVYGYDFVLGTDNKYDSDPDDDNGHGTHVAGIAGATGDNGIGISGVDWRAQLMAVRVLANDPQTGIGTGSLNDIVAGINYINKMRADFLANPSKGANVRVINASLSVDFPINSPSPPGAAEAALPTLRQAIANSGANGTLFVAAAGNSAINNDTGYGVGTLTYYSYPAKYDLANMVVVANQDATNQLYSTSNYGATSVDLAAPGVGIYSTVLNGGYANDTGTSMSAPQVAGTAALMFTMYDRGTYQDIKDDLLSSVSSYPSLSGKVATGGVLNAGDALKRTANRAFVEKLYTDILQRPANWRTADQSGYNGKLNLLNSGTPRYTVALSVTTSSERINNLIQGFYRGYLGRPNGATQTEVDVWRNNFITNGWTIEQMRSKFLASDEFYFRFGNPTSNFNYVQNLYTVGLGRINGAPPADVQAWTDQLNNNSMTREQVAYAFVNGVEGQKAVIKSYYVNLAALSYNADFLKTQLTPGLLRRPGVTESELQFWYDYKLNNNKRAEEIEALFAEGGEFYQRVV